MLFWICVVIALMVALVFWFTDEAGWFGSLFCGAIAGALLLMIVGSIISAATGSLKVVPEYQAPLKALATSKSVSGTFFLGSGSINGKRTINYITADGNRNYVQEADASMSVVIEDTPATEGPYVMRLHECVNNPWIMPWSFCREAKDQRNMEFHIPAGSVLSDYTVDNK